MTHSFTHSLIHRSAYLFTHAPSLIHSFTHSIIASLIDSPTHSFNDFFIYSPIHSFIPSHTFLFIYSPPHPLLHPFIQLLLCTLSSSSSFLLSAPESRGVPADLISSLRPRSPPWRTTTATTSSRGTPRPACLSCPRGSSTASRSPWSSASCRR